MEASQTAFFTEPPESRWPISSCPMIPHMMGGLSLSGCHISHNTTTTKKFEATILTRHKGVAVFVKAICT